MFGSLKVRQLAALATGLAFFLLTASTALGVVTILLDEPRDNSSVRGKVSSLEEGEQSQIHLGLIEPLAVADRARPLKGNFPWSFEGQSREQIEKRLGKRVDWKAEEYVRPAGGNERLVPSHINHEDIEGLMERSRYYALKDVGGIWIFYSKAGVAILPSAVYLRTDADFVPLRRVEDLPKRLAWERPKLEQLRLWLGIRETIAKNAEGEWEVRPRPDE